MHTKQTEVLKGNGCMVSLWQWKKNNKKQPNICLKRSNSNIVTLVAVAIQSRDKEKEKDGYAKGVATSL